MEQQLASNQRRSTKTKPSEKPDIPSEDINVFPFLGVTFYIMWDKLAPGSSFFLPTTAQAEDVQKALRPYTKWLRIRIETRNRCEYGLYGVRVWRVI